MMRMIAAVRPLRPDFSFLTGWDAALMPMLLIGCDGGTNATSGVVPEITRKLYDLTMSRQLDEARDLQYRLLHLFDAMLYSAEFPEGFRAALQLRGFDTGAGRQPQVAQPATGTRLAGPSTAVPAGRRRVHRRTRRWLPGQHGRRSRTGGPHRRPYRRSIARPTVEAADKLAAGCPTGLGRVENHW